MKKIIVIALLVLAPISVSAEVDKQAGVEFLSPLVQTIIQLLQDRIAVLAQEVESLKGSKLCGVVQSPVVTPQQKASEMNAQEANRIRFEFSQKYIALDEKINTQIKIVSEAKAEMARLGSGISTVRKYELEKIIKDAEVAVPPLHQEKTTLQIEERKQLSFVGVY